MNRKIGVLDSGIGGLTVVSALQKLLPNEDIVYFGDNKNCPYGNRPGEEILSLTMDILRFMEEKDVKVVAIACNTISTLIDKYKDKFDFPIIDIINPTVDYIIETGLDSLGILGTEFTIKTGSYQRLLLEKNKELNLIPEGSKQLATLVDSGHFDSEDTREVIRRHIENMLKQGDMENLVLACTHFPIVEKLFLEIAPKVNLINPGFEQAKEIEKYLHTNNLLNNGEKSLLQIYTSGDSEIYEKIIQRLNLQNVQGISTISLL